MRINLTHGESQPAIQRNREKTKEPHHINPNPQRHEPAHPIHWGHSLHRSAQTYGDTAEYETYGDTAEYTTGTSGG